MYTFKYKFLDYICLGWFVGYGEVLSGNKLRYNLASQKGINGYSSYIPIADIYCKDRSNLHCVQQSVAIPASDFCLPHFIRWPSCLAVTMLTPALAATRQRL